MPEISSGVFDRDRRRLRFEGTSLTVDELPDCCLIERRELLRVGRTESMSESLECLEAKQCGKPRLGEDSVIK